MIAVLGLKRILVVLCLVALNCALAGGLYLYLVPEVQKAEKEIRTVRSKETAVRGDIDNIQLEFEQLAKQQNEYEALRSDGFFTNQSRRHAQEVFLAAKQYSGVMDARVNVKPGAVVANEHAQKADQVMLESPVQIDFTSVDDTDIYEYIYYLDQVFPGYLSVNSVNISRKSSLNETILRAIATGVKPPLVEGTISLTWRTMVSKADYASSLDQQAGGMQ